MTRVPGEEHPNIVLPKRLILGVKGRYVRVESPVAEAFDRGFEVELDTAATAEEPRSLKVLWSIFTVRQILSNVALKGCRNRGIIIPRRMARLTIAR
jgi:hypothetical protein